MKKIKQKNKIISILLVCFMMLCITACSAATPQAQAEEDVSQELPIYLSLHFGNGEVLTKEFDYLAYPSSRNSDHCHGFQYEKLRRSNFNTFVQGFSESKVYTYADNSIYFTLSVAHFPDGTKYPLSEIKHLTIDRENGTLHAYLWRDEPYATEREYFDVITANTNENP